MPTVSAAWPSRSRTRGVLGVSTAAAAPPPRFQAATARSLPATRLCMSQARGRLRARAPRTSPRGRRSRRRRSRTMSGSGRSSSSAGRRPPLSAARDRRSGTPEETATSSSLGSPSMISGAWRLIEPVAPKRAMRFIATSLKRGSAEAPWLRRHSSIPPSGLGQGEHAEVGGWGGEDDRVHLVQDAAVAHEDAAGVLTPRSCFTIDRDRSPETAAAITPPSTIDPADDPDHRR